MSANDQTKTAKWASRQKDRRSRQLAAISLLLVLLTVFSLGCGPREAVQKPAEFGRAGLDFALDLAHSYPFRSPYSEEEAGARRLIVNRLEEMGLKPEVKSFYNRDGDRESANILLNFPGTGFHLVDPALLEERGQTVEKLLKSPQVDDETARRQVIVCANYDVAYAEAEGENMEGFDGLSDNASGVATLLTLAEQLKNKVSGYDVQLLFLGAGHDAFRGAESFLESLPEDDRRQIDGVYVVESLLAGDKLYAHAGRSALEPGEKQNFRRKLYELTGVIFEEDLPDLNEIDILYNESTASVEFPKDSGKQIPYREFTLKEGNYLPFDQAGIPIVYIESGNYDFKKTEDIKESTRSNFEATGGQVSGTEFDASEALLDLFGEDLFIKRINNVAFILEKCIEKGVYNGLPVQMVTGKEPDKAAESNDRSSGGKHQLESARGEETSEATSSDLTDNSR